MVIFGKVRHKTNKNQNTRNYDHMVNFMQIVHLSRKTLEDVQQCGFHKKVSQVGEIILRD